MTLAEKIIDLTKQHPELTSSEIGARLGCNAAYVRTVWQRHREAVGATPRGRRKAQPTTHRQLIETTIAEFIRDDIMGVEFTEEGSILLLSGFAGFGENEERIASELQYAEHFVKEVGQRLRANKIWVDGIVATDIFTSWNEGEGLESTIVWNLCLLAAKGNLCCTFDAKGERLWWSVEARRKANEQAKPPAVSPPKPRRRIEPRKRIAPPPAAPTSRKEPPAEPDSVVKWRENRDSRLYKSSFEPRGSTDFGGGGLGVLYCNPVA